MGTQGSQSAVTRRLRRRALVAALTLLTSLPAAASAGGPAAPASTPEEWIGLSREIAAAWRGIQDPSGFYPDYIRGRSVHTRYGEAMLGYAQIINGIRDGDEAAVDSGARAVDWAVRVPVAFRRVDRFQRSSVEDGSVFENLAIAASYNLLKRNRPDHPVFRAARRRWENRLRGIRFRHIGVDAYYNKHAVESVVVLELLATGIRSRDPSAILRDRRAAHAAVRQTINVYASRHAARHMRELGGGLRGFVLSDPPVNPPAYTGLSFGFFARAVELLGPRADARAKRVLMAIGNTLWASTAPDGAVSYWGRSQEQAWSDTWTAYGAEMTARVARRPQDRARFQALADRTIRRVIEAHGVRPEGLNIVPALARDFRARRGLDHYAGAVDYNGNAIVGLNWAIGARGAERSPSRIGADRPGSYVVGTGRSRIAVVRRPRLWYAVKETSTRPVRDGRTYVVDLRYDFGLVAMKRIVDGRWVDAMAQRPYTVWRRVADSAGPVLLHGGQRYFPYGWHLRVGRRGVVTIEGKFVSRRNRSRHRTRFVLRPTSRGAILTFRSPERARYEVSRFVPGRGVYGSGIDGSLARRRRIVRPQDGTVSIRYP